MKKTIAKMVGLAIMILYLFVGSPVYGSKRTFAELLQSPNGESLLDSFFKVFAAEEPIYLIVVEKDHQRLLVLEYDDSLKVVAEYACATGEDPRKKRESGDSRTPEGIYFISRTYIDDKITIFGNRAFHLDYPNPFDEVASRNGDGIYIHGTKSKNLRPNSTKGCISLKNGDLDELVKYLRIDATPVVIVPNIGTLMQRRSIGFDKGEFELAKALLLPDEINREKVEMGYLYVINAGLQTVVVGEFLQTHNAHSTMAGYSRAYLQYIHNEGWSARKRVWRTTPAQTKTTLRAHSGKTVLPGTVKDKQKVLSFLERWRQSWEGKQIETYIACYNKSFTKDGMDLVAWQAYKEKLNKKYKFINVDISNINIDWNQYGAKVSFQQIYRSDKYCATGQKILYVIYNGQDWEIRQELWLRKRAN